MSNFKFKRVKNKFRWESDFMVLEFSEPSIQGISSFIKLESEKDIMYYYYTVKIFKKVAEWTDNDEEIIKWKLVAKRHTHDFPNLLDLKYIIEYQLEDDTTINGQKLEYRDGDTRYQKIMSTTGFACDDFYEIKKIVESDGKDFGYTVYVGTTFDRQGDLNSVGIRTPYVDRNDIHQLLNCVSAFVKYSIDEENKIIDSYISAYEVKNNKIYEYGIDENGVNKNKIENIHTIGDILDIDIVINNKEYSYYKVVISEISNEQITLNNGDTIKPNSIVFISNNPTDEMVHYKETEIAQDFINVLSDEEKQEFINYNTETLMNKYKMAIIDRTAMCMDEHQFNIDYNSGDNVAAVTPVVEDIINIIKSNLTKNNN